MRMAAFGAVALGVGLAVACGSGASSTFEDPGPKDGGASSGSSGFAGGDAQADGSKTPVPATDVEAVVTADNAFSFGYGTSTELGTYIQGEGADGPGIFDCPVGNGPETFLVPAEKAPSGAFLYVVTWADENVTQGTLAQFKRVGGQAVYSGDGNWQVCAVGTAFDHLGPGPDKAAVDAALSACNAGATGSTYSKGWVTTAGALTPGALGKLAFGETNDDPGGDFPVVCHGDDGGTGGMDAVARWMWFDPLDGQSAFVGNAGNRTKTFLVFRLPADALPQPVK